MVPEGAADPPKNQWLFTQEEVRRSPSSLLDYTWDRERVERMKGCDFILKVGMKLRLPQTTISTACVFLHRFYMRFSLKDFHYYDVAATTIFLATKCEETGRKLSDIVVACAKTAQKNDAAIIDEQSKDYWRWRDVILYNEELLLEALCFDLIIDHPYSQLKEYWRQFNGGREVAKTAWACANDTYRTTIHLCYDSNTIALACLYYASIFSGQVLDDVDNKPWYQTTNINMDTVIEIITIMVELYENSQQVVKDGYDPKALAVAGTEALRLLQEQLAAMKNVSPAEITVEDTKALNIQYPPSTSNGKRHNTTDESSNGHAEKKIKVNDQGY
ncbi:protein of unknown function [Taphrina deformans PYCC 5710]|uniref:Cyclin-like domain-containing protein n=1 Tax=Taphrina deformans (strain PYCC 5710 / ATCC 11124 / CBS 356.35 / IMI 108563 / JCM 9778 / NBRC 8474) TaxID=1097556 RepID=R4XLA0_TAPDE|nr:protein of unknown function [Taphrina deformans PYCC 5710]|eukprot:CCG84089.1 protein of unknown function [Taphrina deformans PYCC 5710]